MKARKKGGAKDPWADHLTRRAKSEGYPARSVYKLEEIQKKFKVLKKGDHVLDLGCAPGSWLLYAAQQVGSKGSVLGIDLKTVDIKLPGNVQAIQDDILEARTKDRLSGENFQAVISDMAPATTGRKDVDALRSCRLCEMALDTALSCLEKGGSFVCKIFQGQEFKAFQGLVQKNFKECRVFKPESCRKQSKEIFMIAKGKL